MIGSRSIEQLKEHLCNDTEDSNMMVRHCNPRTSMECGEIRSICETNPNHYLVKSLLGGIKTFPDNFELRVSVAHLKSILENKEVVVHKEFNPPFEDHVHVVGESLDRTEDTKETPNPTEEQTEFTED